MIADLTTRIWDVAVIGTGIGGGTIARRLAERGLSVLILERGPNGPRGEQHGLNPEIRDPVVRQALGFWPTPILAAVDGRPREILGTVGAGVGGTSVFYAAALERPERHDFETCEGRPHPTGGWPVDHDAFASYYAEAEALYQVHGTPDPLDAAAPALPAPPAMSAGDAALMQAFRDNGLHPYRMHVGMRYLPDCRECTGRKCPRACKMDGRSAGVEPALATGRAALLDGCEVTRLCGTRERLSHLEAVRGGERLTIRARRFVLAAGALGSPRLLLASASEAWPDGCANESGLVGRNLMFHLNELIAIWPPRAADFGGLAKTLALRDFYFHDGQRFGLVQSLGLSASYGNIVQVLSDKFDRTMPKALRPLRGLTRIPARIAAKLLGDARVFVGILEDLPYPGNRVVLEAGDPDRLKVEYALAPELVARRRAFRRLLKRVVRGQRSFYLNLGPELNFGHPCGTLRFGTDPATSVLDPSCRAHALPNLHVVDSSFMPTSTGVNPSLTIAANALRVADRLAADRCEMPAAGSESMGRPRT